MELLLKRKVFTDLSTTGRLFIDGIQACMTLEDKDRDLVATMPATDIAKIKVYAKTAIPRGRYEVVLSFSNRFQKLLPELKNVPGFKGIRIHPGNKPDDTEGCILTGTTASKNWVNESRAAFAKVMKSLHLAYGNEKIFITIE